MVDISRVNLYGQPVGTFRWDNNRQLAQFEYADKNISFLMGKQGKWSLSPAYDMGFAYNPKGGWTAQHQMSINGKFDDITRSDLLEFAKRNNIKEAAEIIDRITEVSSQWPFMAKECGVPRPMIDAIVPNLKLSI